MKILKLAKFATKMAHDIFTEDKGEEGSTRTMWAATAEHHT